MLFFNVLEETIIVISRSINCIAFTIANEAFLSDFLLPDLNFVIFGFLLIEKSANN